MIDFHTHCHRPEHWGCEWDRHWKPVYGRDAHDYGPQEYDRAMAPVTAACVFGIRATAAGVLTPNAFTERFCAETATETIGFMALDPTDPDVLDQLADGVARGLRGIKLYPVLALFDPRDPADIGGAIRDVLDAPGEWAARGLERAAGFSWQATARAHEELYRELL